MKTATRYAKSLTKPQVKLLRELRAHKLRGAKNVLGVITTPCSAIGEWIGKDNFSVNIVADSIFKLSAMGFITFQTFQDFDLRFEYADISALGMEALKLYE